MDYTDLQERYFDAVAWEYTPIGHGCRVITITFDDCILKYFELANGLCRLVAQIELDLSR